MRIFVPKFQFNAKINGLFHVHRAHAIEIAHIYNADTAHFDEVARQLRRAAGKAVGRDACNFHHIIRHKSVAHFYHFYRRFTFANAAWPLQKNADAKYIQQHAVQ